MTSRWLRGRLVAAVTAAPAGSWVALPARLGEHDADAIASRRPRPRARRVHGPPWRRSPGATVTALGRHPNLLIGLLLAVVAVLVIVAIVGLGAPATQVPKGAIGRRVGPVPLAEPTPTPTPPPVATVPEKGPVALESLSTFEIEPGVMAECGRIDRAACEQAITLARAGNEGDIVGTTLIVVDDSLPAGDRVRPARCRSMLIVAFVTAGGDTTGWYVYHVVATDPAFRRRQIAGRTRSPQHIVDRIRAALATP